jgi:hypothetical protein
MLLARLGNLTLSWSVRSLAAPQRRTASPASSAAGSLRARLDSLHPPKTYRLEGKAWREIAPLRGSASSI